MHLKHIKLAGFKSFAEPVHIPLPGRLIGVVGPNGCGKSNVIDAVRWVLGESQARQLRGETLQDVIFGGTAQRKSQGRASVELVFDNTDGRAPGQWSQYAELSVRRVLARDGVSNYTINNIHVRRRDVQDMFMGTGLGPRAYAIIEQGMISRIIESRPEELRIYLEEAAGISRYRERRRETEQRLEEAREHLARTRDLRVELVQRIERLREQAAVAQQWRSLTDQLSDAQNRQIYARLREALDRQQRAQESVQSTLLASDLALASLRSIERAVEQDRQGREAGLDAVRVAQEAVYKTGSMVSAAEADLQHWRQDAQRMKDEIDRLEREFDQDRLRYEEEKTILDTLIRERQRGTELEQVAQERWQQEKAQWPTVEAQEQTARQRLESHRRTDGELQRAAGAAQAERQQIQRMLVQDRERAQQLQDQKNSWVAPPFETFETLRQQLRQQEVEGAILQAQRENARHRRHAVEQRHTEATSRVVAIRHGRARLEAEIDTLRALLPASTETSPDKAARRRLWQSIEVVNGFEIAIEAVLGARINALERSLAPTPGQIDSERAPGTAAWFWTSGPELDALGPIPFRPGWRPLGAGFKAKTEAARQAAMLWLGRAWLVPQDDLFGEWPTELAVDACLVGANGWIRDRCSLSCPGEDGSAQAILSRLRAVGERETALADWERREKAAQEELDRLVQGLASVRDEQRDAEQRLEKKEANRHRQEMWLTRLQGEWERHQTRLQQHHDETLRLQHRLEQENEQLVTLDASLTDLDTRRAALRHQIDEAVQQWNQSRETMESRRQSLQSAERSLQEARFWVRTQADKQAAAEKSLRWLVDRLEKSQPRLRALREERAGQEEQPLLQRVQQALEVRAAAERQLQGCRRSLDTIEHQMREREAAGQGIQRERETLTAALETDRLREQEARLHAEQADSELNGRNADRSSLENGWADDKQRKSAGLGVDITRLTRQIEALGPINLAALQELEGLDARLTWQDSQVADLESAAGTLESAMKTIDRETRQQLKETFEQVNRNFSTLFPTLFGGGYARIELSGEEILDAGLQIVAQPPGKKTASIHLFSGGEKSLTALALVFSLFKLNPAPFCLLDEVDAPLDDANTERFARMVQQMSQETQFIFITHNKIAMEMASQLIGITMAESGVSRMVAVDIEEAVRMVETVAV